MNILYTTDLHGATWKYYRLLDTARQHAVQVVINDGDMLPLLTCPVDFHGHSS